MGACTKGQLSFHLGFFLEDHCIVECRYCGVLAIVEVPLTSEQVKRRLRDGPESGDLYFC
jgi:hypothetical protein